MRQVSIINWQSGGGGGGGGGRAAVPAASARCDLPSALSSLSPRTPTCCWGPQQLLSLVARAGERGVHALHGLLSDPQPPPQHLRPAFTRRLRLHHRRRRRLRPEVTARELAFCLCLLCLQRCTLVFCELRQAVGVELVHVGFRFRRRGQISRVLPLGLGLLVGALAILARRGGTTAAAAGRRGLRAVATGAGLQPIKRGAPPHRHDGARRLPACRLAVRAAERAIGNVLVRRGPVGWGGG
jgi:hypothetical protein